MLELWGIGEVTKQGEGRQAGQSEVVTMEVNFLDKKKDGSAKNQVMKVKAWDSVGATMKQIPVGARVLVAGKLEVSEYEWQGKPARSVAISASAVQATTAGQPKPAARPVATDFSEFGDADLPF